MIKHPISLEQAVDRLSTVAGLAVRNRIPGPIQEFMVEVQVLAALRATYGCGNALAIARLAWRRIWIGIHDATFPILHPIEAQRMRAEIAAEMDGQ